MANTLYRLATLLWLAASLALSASAGLYGTSPVASTVWDAGRSQTITWTDDKSAPHLAQLGTLDIELLSGADDEAPVATLARGVSATARSHTVWVSPTWAHNTSDYYLRFRSARGPAAYSAFFTILGTSAVAPAAPLNASTTAGAGDTLYTPLLTLVLPNTTVVSALAPQRTSARPVATAPPVSSADEDAYLHAHGESSPNSAPGRRVDYERLKFRLVFVVWPALVGITMAL